MTFRRINKEEFELNSTIIVEVANDLPTYLEFKRVFYQIFNASKGWTREKSAERAELVFDSIGFDVTVHFKKLKVDSPLSWNISLTSQN